MNLPDNKAMPGPTAPSFDDTQAISPGSRSLLCRHLGCALLVLVYVHLYELYRFLGDLFGRHFLAIAPLVLPPLLLALTFIVRNHGHGRTPISRPPVLLGLALCLCALALPDPEIAVKRIHVAQYLLLSLVVRHTLASRLQGTTLTVSAILLGCLYGVHDELLQGLHPDRTYGLRDILVNTLAGAGCGLIWHGLALFERRTPEGQSPAGWPWPQRLAPLALLAAVAAMAVPLIAYRHQALPIWPFLPLAALLVIWVFLLLEGDRLKTQVLLTPGILALLFFLYPLAVNALQLPFY